VALKFASFLKSAFEIFFQIQIILVQSISLMSVLIISLTFVRSLCVLDVLLMRVGTMLATAKFAGRLKEKPIFKHDQS